MTEPVAAKPDQQTPASNADTTSDQHRQNSARASISPQIAIANGVASR